MKVDEVEEMARLLARLADMMTDLLEKRQPDMEQAIIDARSLVGRYRERIGQGPYAIGDDYKIMG